MKHAIITITIAAAALTIGTDTAAAGYPWKGHAPPYDFVFGNDFDTHQQTRTTQASGLFGFLYVHATGAVTSDGLPVAHHGNCAVDACDVGWQLTGVPATATYLYQVNDDHPVWLVDRRDIPQPGAYAHFHPLGSLPTTAGTVRNGYLLQLHAVQSFCFVHHHGGDSGTCEARGGVPVRPGIDIATHVNIVASAP